MIKNFKKQETEQNNNKKRIGLGTIGALLGSIIGAVAIVSISQIGYVAAIAGMALSFFTLKGYEILGGILDKIGVYICTVIMIIVVYVSNQLDWAMSINTELNNLGENSNILYTFRNIPYWLKEGTLSPSDYFFSLFILYVFMIIGSWATISKYLNADKTEDIIL